MSTPPKPTRGRSRGASFSIFASHRNVYRLALRIDEGEAHVAIVSTSLGTAMTRDDEKPWWMRVLRRTVPLKVRVQVDVKQYVLRVSPELEVPPGRMKAPYITSRIIGVDVDSNLDISLALRDVRHPFAIKAVDYGIDRLAHLDIETTKPGHDQHLHLRCDAPESSATSANLLVTVLVA